MKLNAEQLKNVCVFVNGRRVKDAIEADNLSGYVIVHDQPGRISGSVEFWVNLDGGRSPSCLSHIQENPALWQHIVPLADEGFDIAFRYFVDRLRRLFASAGLEMPPAFYSALPRVEGRWTQRTYNRQVSAFVGSLAEWYREHGCNVGRPKIKYEPEHAKQVYRYFVKFETKALVEKQSPKIPTEGSREIWMNKKLVFTGCQRLAYVRNHPPFPGGGGEFVSDYPLLSIMTMDGSRSCLVTEADEFGYDTPIVITEVKPLD